MANFVNRFVRHKLIASYCWSLTMPEITLLWKRQLPSFHLNSPAPSPRISHNRCISTVTSPNGRKVVQGRLPCSSDSAPRCRSYSSAEHGFPKTVSAEIGSSEADTSLPINESWTPETVELYEKLSRDLIEQGNWEWLEPKTSLHNGEKRLFTKAVISEFPGKFFEYQFFYNAKQQRLKGVIQFGPYTQGPPGCVHGGASAAMMDSAIGVCVNKCFSHCVTATLSMNYKSILPLGSTALVESRLDKVEGRKIFGSVELKSPDGKTTYLTANALFIQLDLQGKDKNIADKLKKQFRKPS